MTIDRNRLLNWPFEDIVQSYGEKDAILYALGIGLGADPVDRDQLRYTYEKDLQVFPTMTAVLGHPKPWSADPASGIDRTKLVHGEQRLEMHAPLPAKGTIRARERIREVIDKGEGRGALVYAERKISDDETGAPLATLEATVFCRADGGFGGPAGPTPEPRAIPERDPDQTIDLPTLPQQALLYRLNADWNPLHADPDIAEKAGFPQPILHGLCTWGIAAHAVVKACCDYDAARLRRFETRFSKPVLPGETLSVEIWRDGTEVSFRAWVREREAKVLDNGYAEIAG